MRDFITYGNAIAVLSIVAAGGAIYLAFTDNKTAAVTMGALFVAMGIVSQLQHFKSFKAFAIEAQLQDRIDRADELIKQLRRLSLLVAKAGYGTSGITTMAFGGVQGSGNGLTRDFDDLLATLKLTKAEMAEVRQPLLRAIAYRIYARFLSVMQSFPILPDDERGKNIVPKDIGTLMNSMQFSVLNIDTEDDMKKLFAAFLPDGLLPDQRKAAGKYVDQLVALYKECKKAGGPTPDFLAFETRSFTNVGTGETARAIYDGVPIPEPEPTR